MAVKRFLPFAFLIVATPAVADLYVSPVVRDTVEYDVSSGPDEIAGSSTVHGDFVMQETTAPGNNLMRYGSNVPLFVALDYLVPGAEAWRVHLDDGIENRVISWEGGSTWEGVLTAIAEQNSLSIVMNHGDKAIGVAETEEIALSLAKTTPEVWRLAPERTLRENLDFWANQAGWSLSWSEDLRIDYPITHKATLVGPFEGQGGVVDRLLGAFRNEPIALTATFYTQNKVLRINEAGYSQEFK